MANPPPTWNPAELTAHTAWVRGLAGRLVRDAARADDLVQETLLAALERRPETGRSLKPWLARVLRNRSALSARGEARRRERERECAPPTEPSSPSGEELAEKAEAHADLVRALTRLREPYRTALLLRYFEGLEPRAIARRLGLPSSTVRSHLKRGLAELRAELDRRHGGRSREWALALIPLCVDPPGVPPVGLSPSNPLHRIKTMNPIHQLAIGTGFALLAGTAVVTQLDLTSTEGGGAPPLSSSGVGLAGASGVAPAVEQANGERAVAPGAGLGAPNAPDDPSAVTGIVRDRASGAGIPEYGIRLGERDGATEPELLWTDAEGCFESTTSYAAGTELAIGFLDHPELLHVTRTQRQVLPMTRTVSTGVLWDPEQAPIELGVAVGPTFQLAIEAPFEWTTTGLVATLEVVEEEPWGRLLTSHQLHGPVREGATPWVRFPRAHEHLLPHDRPWVLGLETPDGLWAGQAQVAATDGTHPGEVAITLAPTAQLVVEVETPPGANVHDLATFAEAIESDRRWILWPAAGAALPSGGQRHDFTLGALPAGAYRLLVSSEGQEETVATVDLVAGEVHTERVTLAAGAGLSHVHGTLRSLSGAYEEPITLRLDSLDGGASTLRQLKWTDEGGGWIAPFAFDNLPVGEYQLVIISFSDHFRWDGLPATITPPIDELDLTCRDTDPAVTVRAAVRAGQTGELLPGSFFELTVEGGAVPQMAIGGGGTRIMEGVPLEAPLQWWAAAEGYVPCFGDEEALVPGEPYYQLEISLDAGWGARIEARREDTRAPLAGVEVRLDGVLAGTTGADGLLDLVGTQAPDRIDLHAEGWELAGGDYDPETGELTGFGPIARVRFR